jgi:hypothetical protein
MGFKVWRVTGDLSCLLTGLRVFAGLSLLFLGVMQARLTWRGLWGLSLTRRCQWGGYLLSACLIVVGLALSVSPLPWVALCGLPAALAAMTILALLSSWINRDMRPMRAIRERASPGRARQSPLAMVTCKRRR